MIINRYLIRQIIKPFAVILAILACLFASYSAAGFLADAVNGLLPTNTIAELIGLKVLISFEVLIPISLYLAIILAYGKLYSNSEFTAMYALRVSPARVLGATLTLAAYLAVVVAGLSLVVRPWAYGKLHALSRRAQLLLNVDDMRAGTFYIGDNGNRVIFLGRRAGPNSPARDVFVQLRQDNHLEVIHAQLAYKLERQANGVDGPAVYLNEARIYQIARKKGQTDRALSVQGMIVNPNGKLGAPPAYSSLTASSAQLASSDAPEDVAEFQWRLSTALSALLLAMLAVPLSRAQPRQSKYAKISTAIAIYSAYYLLYTSARTWVQHGVVPSFPGIWWVPALLGLTVAIAWSTPGQGFRARRGRIAGRLWQAPLNTGSSDTIGDHDAA